MRNLIILGLCAGTAASVPILIERNPDLRDHVVERLVGRPSGKTPQLSLAAQDETKTSLRPSATGRRATIEADERGHFLAAMKINGRRVDGMIDTGATMVALNVSTARRLGIAVAAKDFVHSVQTANGSLKAAAGVAGRIEIGRVSASGVPVLVLEDAALGTVLVGMSFLKRLERFGVEDGRLVLVE